MVGIIRTQKLDRFCSSILPSKSLIQVLSICDDITETNTRKWIEEIDKIEESGQEILPINIMTYGGDAYATLELRNRLRQCKIPILTYVGSQAFSSGALIFSCGTDGYRWMAPDSVLMIHDVSHNPEDEDEEEEDSAVVGNQEAERLSVVCYKMLAHGAGKPAPYFRDLVKESGHKDLYLTAEDALAHGLTNHIGIPTIEVKVKSSVLVKPSRKPRVSV